MEEDLESQKKLINEFEAKLNKILADVEQKKSTHLVDILTAVLLSLATVGSAWCAYQSNLWNGIQTFELMDAHQAGRLASQNSVQANQKRSMDAVMLMQFVNATRTGNKELADFYFSRFDSTLKFATTQWLELKPFENDNAPNSPLKMESYQIKEELKSVNELNNYYKKLDSANEANHNSDTYIMLTVIFAAVLFFGGVASTLQADLMKNVCLILSGIIFFITLIVLFNMPVEKLF